MITPSQGREIWWFTGRSKQLTDCFDVIDVFSYSPRKRDANRFSNPGLNKHYNIIYWDHPIVIGAYLGEEQEIMSIVTPSSKVRKKYMYYKINDHKQFTLAYLF